MKLMGYEPCFKRHIWSSYDKYPELKDLRTAELEGLVHQFCANWVYVCSEFVEMNQCIFNLMKYDICNIHINDYDSK